MDHKPPSKTKFTRCVHIFPRFENSHHIEAIRKEHDHLCECIEAHITLVFPFESDLTYDNIEKDLIAYLEDEKTFKIKAAGLEAVDSHGYYLFLNVTEGAETLKKLHYKLHQGVLKPYQSPWTQDGSFVPHITVGRFQTEDQMLAAIKSYEDFNHDFTVEVDRVYVEIIGEDDASIIEGVVTFGKE